MSASAGLADLRRLLALAATALVLLATTVPPCAESDRGEFDADTTCGPAGVVTLSYGTTTGGCESGRCWALVEAPGANAVGLPELGEIHPEWEPAHDPDAPTTSHGYPPGTVLTAVPFALVGSAPVAGAAPPAAVRRICRASPSPVTGVVEVACEGDAPGAACAGILTLRPAAP